MQHKRLWALVVAIAIALVIIITVAVAAISSRPPGKLSADATLVNLAGMCPQGFSRAVTLSNVGGQAVRWQAPALEEAGVTAIHIVPAAGTLQPHAHQTVQVQGQTLRGGFTVTFQWQGGVVKVQFSCNGPQ